jgi:CelD/BcsL family acetyltransferase involved in cellulose biosynthesis
MKITIYREASGFAVLSQEWDDLLKRTAQDLIFMTYRYQLTWWQHLGNDSLLLIAVRNEADQLVGLAPLFTTVEASGKRQLNFVGCVDVSDYLDILIDQDYLEPVQEALLDCLAAETSEIDWDILSLCSLPHSSPTRTRLAEAAQARGWQVEVRQQNVCPVITLADSWETYLAGINKKQRHEIRRKIRRLEGETEARLSLIDSTVGLAEAMDIFVELHRKSTTDKDEFWDEARVRFFYALAEEMAAAGYLKLYFIELNGIKAAALFCFDYDNQFLLYNSGYDPEQFAQLSPGNVLISYTIEAAIQLGRRRYDFLRGDEVYKFRFGAEAEPIYDLEIRR